MNGHTDQALLDSSSVRSIAESRRRRVAPPIPDPLVSIRLMPDGTVTAVRRPDELMTENERAKVAAFFGHFFDQET